MSTDSNADTTTARRRIVQLPLRTEVPLALIVGDNRLPDGLEERLKRAHPVISFPSLSHFLADRPRPWIGIVVARSGAWDPRLDGYVKRRASIALFGLSEESYGWPEKVARVRSIEEMEPWLVALTAPEPPRVKESPKRETRREARAALMDLAPSRHKPKSTPPVLGMASAIAPQEPVLASIEPRASVAAAHKPELSAPVHGSAQLELPELTAPRIKRAGRKAGNAVASVAPVLPAAPAAVPARPRSVAPAEPYNSVDDELKLMRSAAALGLSRAFELLEELRQQALQVVRSR